VKEHGLVLASTSWNADGPQLVGKASGISAEASPSSPASSPPPSLGPALPLLDPEPAPLDPLVADPPPLPLEPEEALAPLEPPPLLETLLSPELGDVSVVPPQPAAASQSRAAKPASDPAFGRARFGAQNIHMHDRIEGLSAPTLAPSWLPPAGARTPP
jgi:hypothetical protein